MRSSNPVSSVAIESGLSIVSFIVISQTVGGDHLPLTVK